MNPGHPPCCQVPFIKRTFEDSACCLKVSKLGTDWGDQNRAAIMLVAGAFSFLGLILSLVVLIGLSTDADTVQDTAWNVGESNSADFYIGPNVMIATSGGQTFKQEWDDVDCENTVLVQDGADACTSCADAALGIVSTVVMAFITSITTLQTNVQRSTRAGDLNCQKFMGMLTAVAGFFGTLFSLSSFVNDCSRELPDRTGAGETIDWSMGPGFACLLLATIIKPIDFFAHLIVPVIKPDEDVEGEENVKSTL
eukprot:CAMPEP_0114432854 /NCGR_PEP_ID=MMETSP0103-20121206/11380_1 /TAXON_ID=37642 ORGANISM="Paraphysomonas imperforata, Strain PA2" /NCGR_SAMPLE_ID=MMETSP0103 /ASSEMBLY_ACC=CAM_ASM_000201 /LENGTH=252 /DNA_ID=CAMNT_0001602563 /DNA_START=45 /DNA_END=803 /DNA_ORIENTATION=-